MGCVQSIDISIDEERQAAKALHDEIEGQLKQERLRDKREVKILMMGPRQSGKSTLLKHMKLVNRGYDESERQAYRPIIFSNIIQFMRAALEAMPYLHLDLAPQNDSYRSLIFLLPAQIETDVLSADIVDALRSLWEDPAVKAAAARSHKFQLNNSAIYYFNSINRLASLNYLPTDRDVLKCKVEKTGITETSLKIGELTCKLCSVGDQRGERRKWIQCFEGVPVVVFVASLSDYDQMLYEDEGMNRMQATFDLFDLICNSRWFIKTDIVLLLNKIDLFAEKLSDSPLEEYFPDYTGGNDYYAACDYLLHRFVSLNQNSATRLIRACYTCATDAGQMDIALTFIKDSLVDFYLREGAFNNASKLY